LLGEFSRTHPQVMLDLEDAISEDAVRAVAQGAAELGVIGDNVPASGLQTRVCHVDELVLMMPASHALAQRAAPRPVPIAQVLAHDLVAFSRRTSLTRQLAEAAERLQRPLRIHAQVRSFDAMGRMVAAGLGLAVLPREGAIPYAHAFKLVLAPLADIRTERPLLWVMRDADQLSAPARALVAMADRALAARGRPSR